MGLIKILFMIINKHNNCVVILRSFVISIGPLLITVFLLELDDRSSTRHGSFCLPIGLTLTFIDQIRIPDRLHRDSKHHV